MRKRSIKLIFEKLMWGIIMFIPVIAFALGIGSRKFTFTSVDQPTGTGEQTYYEVANNFDLFMSNWDSKASALIGQKGNVIQTSEIYHGLQQIERYILVGTSGSNPQNPGAGNGILIWAVWVIIVEIIHLAVDVILFIPRWAHGVMDTYLAKTGGED